jgi:hypothetical protein
MASTLVVFYSYTGTSRELARLMAAQQGWPLGEIVDLDRRAGAQGTWRCLLDSLLRRHPAIRYQGPDPSGHDTVVLVSPIWAYRLAGPMRSFVAQQAGALRRVAVVSVMGSAGAVNAVAEISHLLGRVPVDSAAFTSREVLDGSCAPRLQAFGDDLRTQMAPVASEPRFT